MGMWVWVLAGMGVGQPSDTQGLTRADHYT